LLLKIIGGKKVTTNNEPEKLTLTVSEAASLLGLSRNSAYQGIKRNEIPHIRVGKRFLIPRQALERLLNEAAMKRRRENGQ
jgi:excisionase family DNA binding protein